MGRKAERHAQHSDESRARIIRARRDRGRGYDGSFPTYEPADGVPVPAGGTAA